MPNEREILYVAKKAAYKSTWPITVINISLGVDLKLHNQNIFDIEIAALEIRNTLKRKLISVYDG